MVPSPQQAAPAPPIPKSLTGKVALLLETRLMPLAYPLLRKNDWQVVVAGLWAIFGAAVLVAGVSPMVDASRESIRREARLRAADHARVLVERNAPYFASRMETRAEIGILERQNGIRLAAIVDMQGRIIAPATRLGQVLAGSPEALVSNQARRIFSEGAESGRAFFPSGDVVAVVEPIKVLNPAQGRNQTVAFALVSIDLTQSQMTADDVVLSYGYSAAIAIGIGLILGFVAVRVTLKPLETLNQDIDRVLSGETTRVTHEYKWASTDSLWEVVQSTLARETRGGGGASAPASVAVEDLAAPVVGLLANAPMGVVVLDANGRVVSMNAWFEEATGIRAAEAIGQELASQARDQAFASLVSDLMTRAVPGTDGVSEELDFAGVPHRVTLSAPGNGISGAHCYWMTMHRAEAASA